jgi:hypothetical protein
LVLNPAELRAPGCGLEYALDGFSALREEGQQVEMYVFPGLPFGDPCSGSSASLAGKSRQAGMNVTISPWLQLIEAALHLQWRSEMEDGKVDHE